MSRSDQIPTVYPYPEGSSEVPCHGFVKRTTLRCLPKTLLPLFFETKHLLSGRTWFPRLGRVEKGVRGVEDTPTSDLK